jgi:hypothetical protein
MSRHPERIFDILRKSLDSGQTVEIEGLGTFRSTPDGYKFDSESQPSVFLAYAVEDLPMIRRLAESLQNAGCTTWLDKDRLMPGQNWPESIDRAIADADAFVACFSPRSIAKRGQFQAELRRAMECARKRPLDEVFLIPARLEPCKIPRTISAEVQYVDLFPDWERGVKRLVRSIRKAARSRVGAVLSC